MSSQQSQLIKFQQEFTEVMRTAELLARARPSAAEGEDAAMSVRVRIAPDAVPERITLAPRWRQAVGPSGLGQAVLQAAQQAALAQLAQWKQEFDIVSR